MTSRLEGVNLLKNLPSMKPPKHTHWLPLVVCCIISPFPVTRPDPASPAALYTSPRPPSGGWGGNGAFPCSHSGRSGGSCPKCVWKYTLVGIQAKLISEPLFLSYWKEMFACSWNWGEGHVLSGRENLSCVALKLISEPLFLGHWKEMFVCSWDIREGYVLSRRENLLSVCWWN